MIHTFLLPILEPMHKQPAPLARAVYTVSNYLITSSITHHRRLEYIRIHVQDPKHKQRGNIVQTFEQRKDIIEKTEKRRAYVKD